MQFSIIVAIDSKNWIWKNGLLPWHIPSDLKYFKKITSSVLKEGNKNAVVMWRNTWESIPEKFRPLPWRLNIVLSSNKNLSLPNWVQVCGSLGGIKIHSHWNIENFFIIGWWMLYKTAMESEYLDTIYITEVDWDFWCDTFFSNIDLNKFTKVNEGEWNKENGIRFRFCKYKLSN